MSDLMSFHFEKLMFSFRRFVDYGTMLEVRDVSYFPDGRAIVDTVGGRRFRVVSRGQRDGYSTAKVEFVKDAKIEESDLPSK